MKKMKTSIAVILMILMMATALGCGGGGGQVSNDTSTVNISIAGLNKTAADSVLTVRSATVASIGFTISAPDMATITDTIPVAGQDTISASFKVPNGSNRHFLAVAYAADNSVLYQGDAFSDLNGTTTNVEILMGVDISGDWTVTHTVQDGQHSDFITYTQTGNSLTLSGDFIGAGTIVGNDIQVNFFAAKDCAEVTAMGTMYADGTARGTFTASGTTQGGCQLIEGTYSGTWTAVRGHITPPVGQGTVSGTVTDALTGNPVDGASVNLIQQGSAVASTTTVSDGTYSLSASAGSGYSLEFSKTGYIAQTVSDINIQANATTTVNVVLTTVLSAGQTRIVLTWGSDPSDLDSHLTGPIPNSSSRFHIYYGDDCFPAGSCSVDNNGNNIAGPDTQAALDHDDTTSFGPETTTIYQQSSGVYRFFVYDFTNGGSTTSTALSNSGAQVRVYIGNALAATYNVPANQVGTVWTVFQLDGSTLTPVNTMSSDETVIQSASWKASLKLKGKRTR